MGPGDTNVAGHLEHGAQAPGTLAARLHRFFERVMTPFLAATGGARRRHLLFASMAGLVLLDVSLAAFALVVMKMLPFDKTSELKVVVDPPEVRTLENTQWTSVAKGRGV